MSLISDGSELLADQALHKLHGRHCNVRHRLLLAGT
jgi:hypothetical protein